MLKKFFNICKVGNIEEVRKALTAGADPTQKVDQRGNTALHAAAIGGQLVVVELLLEQPGVDVNAATEKGHTVLLMAAGLGHMEILALLLRQPGLDLNLGILEQEPSTLQLIEGTRRCSRTCLPTQTLIQM